MLWQVKQPWKVTSYQEKHLIIYIMTGQIILENNNIWFYLKDINRCVIIAVSPVNTTSGKGGL